tara:strand:- start:214 stop:1476 length:1263 start_codon:yes stop_codon:yes gene_type:complete
MPCFGMKIVLITQRLKMDIILEKINKFKINKKLLHQYSKSKCNKIVSIVYFGRSGSQFLYGLLESHPNFLSIKSEFRAYWSNKYNSPAGANIKDQLFNFLELYATLNKKGEHQMVRVNGTNLDIHIPKDFIFSERDNKIKNERKFPNIYKFIRYFLELSSIRYKSKKKLNNKEFFDTIFLSYSMCICKPAQKEFIILYNHHVPDKYEINTIEKNYLKTTIIHTIRHPIQTFVSHIKRYLEPKGRFNGIQDKNIVSHCLSGLFKDDQQLKSRDNSVEYAIKLEDLHKNLKLELNKIFKNLNIKFDNSCLKETFDGSFTPGITGFDGKHIKNTRKQKDLYNFTRYLSNKDIMQFQKIFRENYHKWNYKFLEETEEKDNRSKKIFDFVSDIEEKHNFEIDDQQILDLIFKKASTKNNIFELLK